ncbi:IS5 family transposase [Gluconobacter albidus]|uniref:IS5 family transposase n=1 Tax=Gluconobacter albidus TaxID=318683 RepID=UPI0009EA3A9E|nr:IS5 family transposase [Gluconobacter albidus]
MCSGYSSDLTEDQWVFVRRHLPRKRKGGRWREVDMRRVLDGIFYLLENGCKWRNLPKDFPPWQTVYRHFSYMSENGHLEKIQTVLYELVRIAEGREIEPSCVAMDSQSVKTGKCAREETRGYDNGKKVKGRKRHIIVDTLGNIVDAIITKANEHDAKGGMKLMQRMKSRWKLNRLKKVVADKGYRGETFSSFMQENFNAEVEIGENHTSPVNGFVPAKTRWVVERGFAWLGNCRRLSVDHERLIRNSENMLRLSMIRLMLRKLFPVPCLW